MSLADKLSKFGAHIGAHLDQGLEHCSKRTEQAAAKLGTTIQELRSKVETALEEVHHHTVEESALFTGTGLAAEIYQGLTQELHYPPSMAKRLLVSLIENHPLSDACPDILSDEEGSYREAYLAQKGELLRQCLMDARKKYSWKVSESGERQPLFVRLDEQKPTHNQKTETLRAHISRVAELQGEGISPEGEISHRDQIFMWLDAQGYTQEQVDAFFTDLNELKEKLSPYSDTEAFKKSETVGIAILMASRLKLTVALGALSLIPFLVGYTRKDHSPSQ